MFQWSLWISACALLSVTAQVAIGQMSLTPRPAIDIQVDPTRGEIWMAAGGENFAASADPETIFIGKGTPGTTRQVEAPVLADPISQLESGLFLGDTLLVWARGAESSVLFRTDGTQAGTYVLWSGDYQGECSCDALVACGSVAYFRISGALWRTDGTQAGTFRLASGGFGLLHDAGSALLTLRASPLEIWSSEGSVAGTRPWPGSASALSASEGSVEAAFGGEVLFCGLGPSAAERLLWRVDLAGARPLGGTTGDIENIYPAPDGRSAFYVIKRSEEFREVWWADGAGGAARSVGSLSRDLSCGYYALSDGEHLFMRLPPNGPIRQYQMWVTDQVGDSRYIEPREGAGDPIIGPLVLYGGRAYFAADDGVHGRELWSTHGTAGGTAMVADLSPGPRSSFSSYKRMQTAGNRLYFEARAWGQTPHLWRIDFRPADFDNNGTVAVGDALAFVKSYLGGEDLADIDADGTVGIEDVFAWLTSYFEEPTIR